MARKRAVTLGKSTRILRPDERQRLNEGLPSGLNPFERFFAGLLRSEASEFLYEGTGTWNSICKRLKLPCPTEPIKAYYGDQKLHFAYRASLVIEEARFSIANGIMAMHKRSQNTNPNNNNNNNKLKNNNANGRRESRSDVMSVSLVNVEPREKTGHTVLTFAIKRKGPISPEELSNLRHGQVFACVSQKLAPTVTNAHLGCILPGNREEIIETKSFQVMVFKSIKKTSGGTLWDLTPITSLLTEQRKFEACTSDITRSVPFLYPLLGGKGPTHIRFEEDSNGDTVSVNVKGEESSAEEDGDLVSPVSEEDMKLVFNAPRLNKIQERAASTFLNAEPNTITLIQG